MVAEAAPQQILGVQPCLDHRGSGPLRGDRNVVVEVPPDVVSEVLLAAVCLPRARYLEGVVIDQRHTARALAVGTPQVRHEDAAWSSMHGVRPGVAGLGGALLG